MTLFCDENVMCMLLHFMSRNYFDHSYFLKIKVVCIHITFSSQNIFKAEPSPQNSPLKQRSQRNRTNYNWWCLPLKNIENLCTLTEEKCTAAWERMEFPSSPQKSSRHLFHCGGLSICPHRCQQTKGGDIRSTSKGEHGCPAGTPRNPLGCKFGAEVFLSAITTKNQRKRCGCWTMERSSSSQPFHDPDTSRSRDSGSNLAWAWVTAQMDCYNKSALVN